MTGTGIRIVFHRHYEVPIEKIKERFEGEEDMTKDEAAEIAAEIARDWLSDEMSEFLNNTEDFVSHTWEVMK
jgi:hypothetical protein